MVKRDIKDATQSPMNPTRWSVDLACGHTMWISSKRRPKAAQDCTTCSKPLRTKHIDADFRHNSRTELYCLNCQRDINPRTKYREVFYIDGTLILHPDDVGRKAELLQGGTLDWVPVGPDCAKAIGLEWSRPKESK